MQTRTRLLWLSFPFLFLALVAFAFSSARSSSVSRIQPLSENELITILPDQMVLQGDIATQSNSVGYCTESWLAGMPAGSIILGVDPHSCDPLDWGGASARATLFLPDVYSPTVYTLKVSWPDSDGKGLRSPIKDQTAFINLDNHPLWSKRTLDTSTSGDYYGAQHEPILTTIVVTQSITHTLTLTVPSQTAWELSLIELSASPYPASIRGVGYSPYRDCQSPDGAISPSLQDIQDDLFRLSHSVSVLRTYSSLGVNGQIPALANAIGLPVFAGAWIDTPKTTVAQDDAEIQGLINLACTTDLKGVMVGNEYYLRHLTVDGINYLLQRIREVKNGIQNQCGKDVPVTTAETDNRMFQWESSSSTVILGINPLYRPILDELDFIMVHIYPFWAQLPIDGAAAFTVNRYKAIQGVIAQQYPGQDKRVIIGEAGWPSLGTARKLALPSLRNQKKYMLEFLSLAAQDNVDFLYFDAFDELWKTEESGRVGQHWGYSYSDRTAKHSFYGVLLPVEQLPAPPPPLSYKQYLPLIGNTYIAARIFPVYSEWPAGTGQFVPTGKMGDVENLQMFECDRCNPHSGEMAIRTSFTTTGTLGWAGVYWQYPQNNWGNINASLDLSWANKLTFWAKGKVGGERVRFFVGGIGAKNDPYPDSLRPQISTGFLQLTDQWQKYTINLLLAKPEPSYGQNLSHLIGGFGMATDKCANPGGATFFLDDIYYEYDPNLTPPPPPGPAFAIYSDAAAQDNHYFPGLWMGDGTVPGSVSLTECWAENPHSGSTSIKIDYTQPVAGWAGLYWLHPSGNTGDRPGGYDLSGVDRLTFWARSDTLTAPVKFLIGGIGYAVDYEGHALCSNRLEPYPDSVCPKIEAWFSLSPTWTKYTIDLHAFPYDFSKVVGGFGWVVENPLTFYLDDITYEFDP